MFIDKDTFSWLCPTSWSVQQYRWSWGRTKPELEFAIADLVRPALLAIYYPNAADFPKLDTLPDDLTVFSDEEDSLRVMVEYDAMVAAKMLDCINVTMPVIRKVSGAGNLKEFFSRECR